MYKNPLDDRDWDNVPEPDATEWCVVADRESGATIVRAGLRSGREAAVVRRELEDRDTDSDPYTNYLILTRTQADTLVAEDVAARAKWTCPACSAPFVREEELRLHQRLRHRVVNDERRDG